MVLENNMNRYNPNNHYVLVDTKQGLQVGKFNVSNLITNKDDEILCSTEDTTKFRYFTECLVDMKSVGDYNFADKVVIGSVNWFVLEKYAEENLDKENEQVYS